MEGATENQRLSNRVDRTRGPAMSSSDLAELLRLRGEVSRLREQTNALQKLQVENRQLADRLTNRPPAYASMSETELKTQLSTETLQAMKNILAALPAALQSFADHRSGERPSNLAALRDYFPTNGGRLPGLYTFEFARDEGPLPGDAL